MALAEEDVHEPSALGWPLETGNRSRQLPIARLFGLQSANGAGGNELRWPKAVELVGDRVEVHIQKRSHFEARGRAPMSRSPCGRVWQPAGSRRGTSRELGRV